MDILPATDKEQRLFFRKNGWIAFEDALAAPQMAHMISILLTAERKQLSQTLDRAPPTSLFKAGQDLWRHSDDVRKLAGNFGWAQIAAQLLDERVLRLIGDQLWLWRPGNWQPAQIPFAEHNLPWISLNQITSCEGILAGCFFNLEGPKDIEIEDKLPLSPFGSPGSVVFVKADLPLELSLFSGLSRMSYCVLIGSRVASYRPAPYDPHPLHLKKLGYRPGEALKEHLHPLLWTAN